MKTDEDSPKRKRWRPRKGYYWPMAHAEVSCMTVPSLNFKVGGVSLSSFPELVTDTEEEGTTESEEEIEKVRWLLT